MGFKMKMGPQACKKEDLGFQYYIILHLKLKNKEKIRRMLYKTGIMREN